ncbi:hypothetical protein AK830_g7403 [Neonectria ditissima]|uniref:t-SNARE coiled-coil homology domain-containing protein n=1 Tax=Neonectria ditissima TaxID=78410 RepID=A0A0P7BAA0_9HYPO|nr:hypothetical protein AK830_g7403 [Neonectria ditissima]
MSSDELSNLESGQYGGYTDDPAFQKLQYDLKSKVQALQNSNQKLTNDVKVLGTRKDTPRLRERVHKSMDKAREMCTEIGNGVKELQDWNHVTKQQENERTKILGDFHAALQKFQSLQQNALEKERASLTAVRAALDDGGQSDAQQSDQLQQLQQQMPQLAPQSDVDFQDILIQERRSGIRQIEEDMADINHLVLQTAIMVTEQGETVNTIEGNSETVKVNISNGNEDVTASNRLQKAARSKSCYLLLILAIIMTIVILAIVLD